MIPADRECWCRGKFWDPFFSKWVVGVFFIQNIIPKGVMGALDVGFSVL